jgi:hypothetical protein
VGGEALPSQSRPLLPNLKALPLRPKVALAPGYVPPPAPPARGAPAKPASSTVRSQGPAKPAPPKVVAPAARLAQPKQAPTAKTAQPASAKAAEAPKSEQAKPEAQKLEPGRPDPAKPEPVKQAAAKPAIAKTQPAAASKAAPSESAPAQEARAAKATAAETPQAPAEAQTAPPPVEQPAKPTANQSGGSTSEQRPKQPAKDTVPNFGAAQPLNVPFAGSLKIKLGIAILLLVVACTTYLGWGSKTQKPVNTNTAASADGSGPSIILGEGGWVEGWGGDPSGLHAGRQITIYRPSLKLSDYRLEFQGSIDTKSVGWVFRAADPDNYYAMKLMNVSSGLIPRSRFSSTWCSTAVRRK